MKEELFRKKSLDKVKSPESLNDCIRVANPGVWLVIVSVILILAGACVWAVFGRIEKVSSGKGIVSENVVSCTVDYSTSKMITPDSGIRIGSVAGRITSIDGQNVTAEINMPNGEYVVEIVTESVAPFSFIVN